MLGERCGCRRKMCVQVLPGRNENLNVPPGSAEVRNRTSGSRTVPVPASIIGALSPLSPPAPVLLKTGAQSVHPAAPPAPKKVVLAPAGIFPLSKTPFRLRQKNLLAVHPPKLNFSVPFFGTLGRMRAGVLGLATNNPIVRKDGGAARAAKVVEQDKTTQQSPVRQGTVRQAADVEDISTLPTPVDEILPSPVPMEPPLINQPPRPESSEGRPNKGLISTPLSVPSARSASSNIVHHEVLLSGRGGEPAGGGRSTLPVGGTVGKNSPVGRTYEDGRAIKLRLVGCGAVRQRSGGRDDHSSVEVLEEQGGPGSKPKCPAGKFTSRPKSPAGSASRKPSLAECGLAHKRSITQIGENRRICPRCF